MNKCTFCGRESESHDTKHVGGYTILECCTDCETEIINDTPELVLASCQDCHGTGYTNAGKCDTCWGTGLVSEGSAKNAM